MKYHCTFYIIYFFSLRKNFEKKTSTKIIYITSANSIAI